MIDIEAEASEAFYKWEEGNGVVGLSDYDRLIWCAGYVIGAMTERRAGGSNTSHERICLQ